MSSTYRIFCLSHDPAITLDREWSNPEGAEQAIAAGLDEHGACDLLIGRHSYPLIEVGCPPVKGARRCSYHVHDTVWVDAAWLRLVLAATQATPTEQIEQALKDIPRCWSPQRLHRLRHLLDKS